MKTTQTTKGDKQKGINELPETPNKGFQKQPLNPANPSASNKPVLKEIKHDEATKQKGGSKQQTITSSSNTVKTALPTKSKIDKVATENPTIAETEIRKRKVTGLSQYKILGTNMISIKN